MPHSIASSSASRFNDFKFNGFKFSTIVAISLALLASCAFVSAQTKPVTTASSAAVVERGKSAFGQNCAFCHGREGFGGESGPNLMDSDLVTSDVRGNKIGPVVRNGRPESGMPAFKLSPQEITDLPLSFTRRRKSSESHPGGRRGVSVSDLQTGNVEAGKQYFNGAGTCSSCHSPTGDLAGIATRYRGLELEMRMLYPRHAKATVKVTTAVRPDGVWRAFVSGRIHHRADR